MTETTSSATVDQVIRAMSGSIHQMANQTLRESWGSGHRDENERLRSRQTYDLAVSLLQLACDAILADTDAPGDVEWPEVGAQLALEGVPVTAAVDWVRTLERLATDAFLSRADGLPGSAVRSAVARIAVFFDRLCESQLEAYVATYDDIAGWYQRIGTDLVTLLASGAPVESRHVNTQARILGVNPHQRFRAVATRFDPPPTGAQWATIRRRLLRAFSEVDPERDTLVSERPGEVLALVPQPPEAPDIVAVLRRLAQHDDLRPCLVVAVGEPTESLASAGRSCRQASSALTISLHRRGYGSVTCCTDVIMEVLLMHNHWVCHRLVESRLGPLLEKPHLLETLRVYLSAEMSLQRTAEELVVHPNTVTYRLRQITGLVGRDVRSVHDITELSTALTAYEVLQMADRRGEHVPEQAAQLP